MVTSPYVSGDHRFDFLSETIDMIGHWDQLADKERHLMKISSKKFIYVLFQRVNILSNSDPSKSHMSQVKIKTKAKIMFVND